MYRSTVLVLGHPPPEYRQRLLSELPAEAEVFVSDEAPPLLPAAPRADVLFLWDTMRPLLQQLWPALGRLRWIHSRAAGLDNLWFPALTESPVTLTNSKGLYSGALAEFAVGAMFFFAKKFRRMLDNQASCRWESLELDGLSGQTVGLLGYGDIGRAVARKAKALDMRVVAVKRRPLRSDEAEVDGWWPADRFKEMMAASDYVVLALPLTPETRGLVDQAALSAMKPTAYLINLGRGATLDEAALIQAIEEHRIAGAALDVFSHEPLALDSPFFRLPNVLLSPHSADHTPGWIAAGLEFFLENFHRYRSGQPLKNIVDKRMGY